MTATIREAAAGDLPALEVVRRQAIEAGFSGRYDRSAVADLVATPDERLGKQVRSDDHVALVVETDVTPACFGVYDVDGARIVALYTAPGYDRRGYASALVDRFERRARRDGRDAIRTAAPVTAVGFFEACGFEREGTTERDGIPVVELRKGITRRAGDSACRCPGEGPNRR